MKIRKTILFDSSIFVLFMIFSSCESATTGKNIESFINSFELSGAEVARTVIAMPDNGIFIGGRTNKLHGPNGHNDIYLVRLKKNLDVLWSKTLGGNYFDEMVDAATNTKGEIYVIGSTCKSYSDTNTFVGKLSSDGQLLWTREIGESQSEYGVGLEISSDGSIIGVSYVKTISEKDGTILLFNLSEEGDLKWKKNISASHPIEPKSILITPSGEIYIGGHMSQDTPYISYSDALLVKTNPSGETIWLKTYHSNIDPATLVIPNRDIINAMALENNSHIVLAASSTVIRAHTGHIDFWFVRVDLEGSIIFQSKYREIYTDDAFPQIIPRSIVRLNSGDYVITGRYYNKYEYTKNQMWVTRFSPQATAIWSGKYGSKLDDEGFGVEVIGNSIYTTGYTTTGTDSSDIYLIELDLNGNEKK